MTLAEMEHAVDALIERLLAELQEFNAEQHAGMTSGMIEDIQDMRNCSLSHLYAAGAKLGVRLVFSPARDGKWYAYCGSMREAEKSMVFLYLNRKEALETKAEQMAYRESFEAVGGNEYYFTSWLTKKMTPTSLAFFKLCVFLDVPVEWRPVPREGA